MSNTKDYLTVDQLAQQMGIARNCAYQLVRQESFFPSFRIGRSIRISRALLNEWIATEGHGCISQP